MKTAKVFLEKVTNTDTFWMFAWLCFVLTMFAIKIMKG